MSQANANRYVELLRRVAAETWVTGEDGYGHEPGMPPAPAADSTVELPPLSRPISSPPILPPLLSHFLYAHYYLDDPNEVATARRQKLAQVPIVLREDARLGAALRAANRGKGYIDPGWRVIAREGEGRVVRKDNISLFVREADLALADGLPEPGAEVSLRFPNDRPYMYPAYYTAVGDGGPATPDLGKPLLRIYFDVHLDGAPALVERLTEGMGAVLARFSVKVLNHPQAYTRPDAAVAYLLREELPRAWPLLRDAVAAMRAHLGTRVPSFACAVAAGVGVAEEPTAEGLVRLSFGQHRCQLIAWGLARAFGDGVDTADGRLRYILREFASSGVDPCRPYLNPGSADVYAPLEGPGALPIRANSASSVETTLSNGE
jgi:hypothetical protein